MRHILALALAALPLMAAVEGTVTNGTTGKPQPNATVTLMNLGAGMNSSGAAKTDANGAFRIAADLDTASPYLIQAMYEGVTYNRVLQPGSSSQGIALEVYDAAAKAPEVKVTQHMILLEPGADALTVNQTVIFTNSGKTTYQDPAGTLRFEVPAAVSTPVQLRITAPQGMPITREAEKGLTPNTYVVRYPIKPGETRVDIQYAMPAAAKFTGRILHGGGPVRFVAPPGVTLSSPQLASAGTEPQTGASIWELKGANYTVAIEGTGALQQAAAAGAQESAAVAGEDPSGGIDIKAPRLHERLPLVIGLGLLMLAVGFAILYRADSGKRA